MVGDAAPVLGVALLARGPGNLFWGEVNIKFSFGFIL